ncbi:MAG: nitrous oxide reductase family maturation protein NosD [Lewinellaceae bacterium]|nr:nitrous oxide reductase family maturation protein NosD [Lewinellaceae bacterium]
MSACNHCTISGNRLNAKGAIEQNAGNAIHAWKCDSLIIKDNWMRGHRDGIYLEFVGHSHIKGNTSTGNLRYGLHFMFSHNNNYEHNRFEQNGAGVAVMYSREVSMAHNTFSNNQGSASYGLLLKEITNSSINHNVFKQNTTGILMDGCSRSHIEQNVFQQNGWAIKLQASCDDNDLRQNNFFGNTFDLATSVAHTDNRLSHNFWDHYEGYDLDKNGVGDVPYRPVSLYAMLADEMPYAMMLWRSFCVYLLDRAEKVIPSISPDNVFDDSPLMKAYDTGTTY